MAVVGDILFYRRNGVDLDAVIRAKTNGLRNVIDALPERVFSQQTDGAVRKVVENRCGAFSGHMKVSFQAATSIG